MALPSITYSLLPPLESLNPYKCTGRHTYYTRGPVAGSRPWHAISLRVDEAVLDWYKQSRPALPDEHERRSSVVHGAHGEVRGCSGSEASKVGPTGLGFVSSNSWDVSGAASAGLTTFWIQRQVEEQPEELGLPATRVVTSLCDLAAVLR
jgi:hypothetical protein